MRNIGTVIKKLRKMIGLSQRELAQNICTQAQISKIEKNNEVPSAVTLYRIAERLGVDMNYFFEIHETPRIDYVNETKGYIRQLIRERNYLRLSEMIESEKKNPLFQNDKDIQFLYWHEAICVHYLKNKPLEAISLLQKALLLTHTNNKRYFTESEIEILNSIAIIKKDMNCYKEAEAIFREGLNGLRLMHVYNSQVKIRVLYGLSKLLTDVERYEESLIYCEEGIGICKKQETLYLLGELFYQCGENYAKLEHSSEATSYFDRAIHIFDIQENKLFTDLVKQYRTELLGINSQ